MPVLPAVPSTTVPPGLRTPRFSASRIRYKPARSLTDPPGLRNSALPRISQPVSFDAERRRIRGVLPIDPRKPSRISEREEVMARFWTLLAVCALAALAGCGGGGHGRDINDPSNSLVFGYVDMADAPTNV